MNEEPETIPAALPAVKRVPIWSIGIYAGETPFDLKPVGG